MEEYNQLRNVGAKPFYKTPEEMAEKAIEYFESLKENQERATVTGLVYFLGFADKKSLRDYREKEAFSPLIKRMLLLVEKSYEMMLGDKASTGAIFALKNMGWIDRVNTDITTKGESINTLTKEEAIKRSNELDDEY